MPLTPAMQSSTETNFSSLIWDSCLSTKFFPSKLLNLYRRACFIIFWEKERNQRKRLLSINLLAVFKLLSNNCLTSQSGRFPNVVSLRLIDITFETDDSSTNSLVQSEAKLKWGRLSAIPQQVLPSDGSLTLPGEKGKDKWS